jgi:hypothetical protein
MKFISLNFRYLFFLALLVSPFSFAQDYAKVDSKVKTYPSVFSSTGQLAQQIVKDFSRPDERARALFTWMAHNIKYDTSPTAAGKRDTYVSYRTEAERRAKITAVENELANRTLRLRKGVCNGYAMLYQKVAEKMGLESEVVHGTAKILPSDIGKMPGKINHAWNAVKINGQWKLIDVTWGAGGILADRLTYKFDDNYFFTSPDVFFLNHYPDNKNWLLTVKSESEFARLPLYYNLNYELMSPLQGTITTGTSKRTVFRLKGLKSTDEVMYQYTSGAFANKVLPVLKNEIGEFGLVLGANAKGTLTIFVNKQPVAAYKLVNQ